jgi:hypothetical protein
LDTSLEGSQLASPRFHPLATTTPPAGSTHDIHPQDDVMARAKTKETTPASSPSRRSPSAPASPDKPTGPLSLPIPPDERDIVKVNNANITELKIACDDALRRVSTSLLPLITCAEKNELFG